MPPLPEDKPQGPTVRLAVTVEGGGATGPESMARNLGPDVRLALGAEVVKTVGEKALTPPTVRLAAQTDGGLNKSVFPKALTGNSDRPALLVSYFYLEPFLKNKHRYHYRDWVMDSGAFSAHNSGADINLQDYIDCCKRLSAEDPTLTEVFALDVIGDWKAGVKNTEEMWRQGVQAIPCFHYGEPWELLKSLARDYPKVAIGGCVGKRDKDKFAGQCFARVWPKKLHGFGFGSEKSLMLYPWHSVDATNWEIAPCKYGQWKAFGGQRVSVRGSKQNLRAEVEWYLELERKARVKWKKQMQELEAVDAPSIRLAISGSGPGQKSSSKDLHIRPKALGQPTVRLAINGKGQGETNGALGPTVRLVGNGDVVDQRKIKVFSAEEQE